LTTEQEVSTGTETQNPAPEVVEIAEPTTEQTEAEAPETAEAAEPEGDEADKALKRMQRRIDKRTADVYRSRAENEQLKQRLAELETKAGKADEPTHSETDPVVLAKQIAKVERFTEKANALVAEGTKKHSDYMGALKDLAAEVGDFVRRDGLPSPFMEAVMEVAEKPTALLYHLGKNPDLAADLADLSPYQLAKRLDRIERELTEKQTPKISNAPKPLVPVRAQSSDSDLGPNLSDQEWLRRREAQLKAARG
jgi:chromosome segregation ATPase